MRPNVLLPRHSSNDTNSDTNLGAGGDAASGGGCDGGESSSNAGISTCLRSAMSDHGLEGATQHSGGVRWHSYSGPPAGSLFDEEAKQSLVSASKISHSGDDESRKPSGDEGVDLITNLDKPSKSFFILAPDGDCVFFWSLIVCAACIYNIWIIPYRFAFNEITHATAAVWFTLDYFADGIYLLDLLLGFRVAYLENGILQRDPRKARQHYLNSTRFYLNCLCILPLDLLYISVGIISLLRILRFVKMYKLSECSDMAQRRTIYPNIFRALSWIVITLTGLHWNACIYQCVIKSVLSSHNASNDALETYLRSTYDSLLCLTLQKLQELNNDQDVHQLYAFHIIEGLVGVTIFTCLIAYVNMLISNAHINENEFRSKSSVHYCQIA